MRDMCTVLRISGFLTLAITMIGAGACSEPAELPLAMDGVLAGAVAPNTPAPTSIQPPTGDGWTTLMQGDWSLEPFTENPDRCVKVLVEEDLFVSAVRPISPHGTHHLFLVLSDDFGADDGCTRAVASGTMLYAAGVGSDGVTMPAGVAMKLPAGSVLNLSLHVYNPGEAPLQGTSGIEIKTVKPADVVSEMSAMLVGPVKFELPAASQTTIRNVCTLAESFTATVLFPHMHVLGTHFKVTLVRDGSASVLHDAAFDFSEQYQLPLDSLTMMAGDQVVTECTYLNTGATPVKFGESSDDEMCITMLFRYPAGQGLCIGETMVIDQGGSAMSAQQ